MVLIKCPSCGAEVDYKGNEFRPFCSERCKLLDLGAWFSGDYAVPSESNELSEEDLEALMSADESKSEET